MSRKWLRHEGEEWVREEIITPEQWKQILSRYPEQEGKGPWLPVLAGVLMGLGILSFVASNWEGIPPLLRLFILAGTMTGFYTVGELRTRKGFPHTGAILTGLGVISFGGGMVLTAQMFHLVAHDVTLFILWGLAGLITTHLYRHPSLFFLTFGILTVAQIYSGGEFQTFSYVSALLLLFGLGVEAARSDSPVYRWFVAAAAVHQSIQWVVASDLEAMWLFPFLMAIYTAGNWLEGTAWKRPLETSALTVAFVLSLFVFQVSPTESEWEVPQPIPFLTLTVTLLACSLLAKWKRGRLKESDAWLLFLPFFYLTRELPELLHHLIYLTALYTASVLTLLRGIGQRARFESNWGIFLFLITTVNAYFNLAWDFMPKSLFFLFGGIILFALNRFLQSRKRASFPGGGDPC